MDDSDCQPYELDVLGHVQIVDPAAHGIHDLHKVDPRDYFITSGDAVIKATHLERDMRQLLKDARKKYSTSRTRKHQNFLRDLAREAARCKALLAELLKVRGDSIFLETTWEDHRLFCIPKNPRRRDTTD